VTPQGKGGNHQRRESHPARCNHERWSFSLGKSNEKRSGRYSQDSNPKYQKGWDLFLSYLSKVAAMLPLLYLPVNEKGLVLLDKLFSSR